MRFDILTIFPDMFNPVLGESIIGRAQNKGLIEINTIDIRDFTLNKHKKVDDYPYGGGSGLVMMAQPIYDAYRSIVNNMEEKPRVVYMSPQGESFKQKTAERLKNYEHIVIICGHYEGVDERVLEEIVDEEISIGDFVVTGGEIPAMLLIDSVSRLIPGVLSNENSSIEESHYKGLLEYPQYTRPYEYNGRTVPEVLISGHHANIQKWRRQQALIRTLKKRPDMFEKLELSEEDRKLLGED